MKTIRARLTRKLVIGFALLLVFGGVGIYFWNRAVLLKEFDAELRAKALAITTLTRQEGDRVDVDFSDRFMRGFDEKVATDFFQMWSTNGTSLEHSESLGDAQLPCRFGGLRQPEFWNLRLPSGFAGRAVGFSFSPQMGEGEERNPALRARVILVVASDRRELNQALATFAAILGVSGLLLLAATVLLVPPLLRQELAPLDQLANQAAQINANSLATRFPVEGIPSELTPISARLNDLLARLEQSFERERRFSADLAHELRTPLAELRTMAEFALEWPEAREIATHQEILATVGQMEGMVRRLLTLLRSENGQLPAVRERIGMRPLIEQAWKPFAQRAKLKRLQFFHHATAGDEVETDPVLLRSILTSLLDNAVEYTPAGGKLVIDSKVQNGRVHLEIANNVENLTAEDVSRLFDRFWRKDPARSSGEHSGLGLSLARGFAQALGYELTARLDGTSMLSLQLSGLVPLQIPPRR
jgi:two-component system sensor histidine kinase QseC